MVSQFIALPGFPHIYRERTDGVTSVPFRFESELSKLRRNLVLRSLKKRLICGGVCDKINAEDNNGQYRR